MKEKIIFILKESYEAFLIDYFNIDILYIFLLKFCFFYTIFVVIFNFGLAVYSFCEVVVPKGLFYMYNRTMVHKRYLPNKRWDIGCFFYTLIAGVILAWLLLIILIPMYLYWFFFYLYIYIYCYIFKKTWISPKPPRMESVGAYYTYTWKNSFKSFLALPKIWALTTLYFILNFPKKKIIWNIILTIFYTFLLLFITIPKWYFYIMAEIYLDLINIKRGGKKIYRSHLVPPEKFLKRSRKGLYILAHVSYNKSVFFLKYKRSKTNFNRGKKYTTNSNN